MVYPIKKDMPFYVTLTVLGLCRYYPLNHQSKMQFYLIYCIWAIIWNASFILGPMLMCIFDIINFDYVELVTTVPVTLAATLISSTVIVFVIKHEMWSELFKRTVDCTKFGKSINFDHLKQEKATFLAVYFVCTISGISIVAIYEIFHENTCLNVSFIIFTNILLSVLLFRILKEMKRAD
ncbi:uncharacterized protein [Euwallacea fornicatus]|uniref:uncharacterized protein n=1 Tax=Euwallacea fornicatus TaxID=995702 RepID=UPI00338E239F